MLTLKDFLTLICIGAPILVFEIVVSRFLMKDPLYPLGRRKSQDTQTKKGK